ncbi:3-carboxy-cis,cis-muconate cycloisomerase [Diaminobutyricibacter tongyongensis]|uniref:3-carboxy-cis,cis-muconate cycloisomerase n=1 Tax=Leifsonia tongyongensis TaxID=1268043 RepID=A0A6L9Y384_9MICO|nr:3-carboxy-cis,cis-muconate cycloisomerase [Diaminobutyricibacter tongyongensis]
MADAFDWGLLEPAGEAGSAAGDDAVLSALVAVERALVLAWADLDGRNGEALAALLDASALDRGALVAGLRRDGVPVISLVEQLRAQAGDRADEVHRGATSQDILDSALMLVSRDVLAAARGELLAAGNAFAALARRESATPYVARTLTQEAEPTTLGAAIAVWLDAVSSSVEALDAAAFPVQLGGAVGTGEAFARLSGRADAPAALRASVARHLHLADPGRAWHTDRSPVLAVAGVAALVCVSAGRVGRALALGARDGILQPDQGGGSSAMPHKHNPVDAVILTANGLRAGGLVATLHAAALSSDARPAGEWHAEWQAWRGLLRLAAESAAVLANAAAHLVVDPPAATGAVTAIAAASAVVDASRARFAALAPEAGIPR